MLIRALIPWLEGGSAEINAVDEELQGFGVELDPALAGLAGGGPAEAAFFESFCRDPEARSVKVEELDAVAALVGEDEEGVAGGGCLKLVGSEGVEAVEGFAHIAGIEREENLEGGTGEVQHRRPPFAARCLRKMAMNSAASGMAA
jgi:hypothetical protein